MPEPCCFAYLVVYKYRLTIQQNIKVGNMWRCPTRSIFTLLILGSLIHVAHAQVVSPAGIGHQYAPFGLQYQASTNLSHLWQSFDVAVLVNTEYNSHPILAITGFYVYLQTGASGTGPYSMTATRTGWQGLPTMLHRMALVLS
jgi:hypothetical protein